MALNLLHTPSDYSSSNGDLIFTLLEDVKPFDSTTYPDYKYVCDLYVNGTNLVARLKSFPRPNDKLGIFNVSNIVRSYLDFAFNFTPNQVRAREAGLYEFFVNFRMNFGDEYGNATYSNVIVDIQRTYFNHYNFTDLVPLKDKVISARPYATSVYRQAKYCLVPFLATDDTIITLIVKTYNSIGLIQTSNIIVTPTATSSNTLQQFNVSPAAINASSPGLINDYIDYYTVEFNTTNITGDSIYRFDLTCETKYKVSTLHFLNRYGGVESKDFTKLNRSSIDITKSDFGNSNYVVESDGSVNYSKYNSNTYYESRRVYSVQFEERIVLNTDILSDEEYEWLSDLFTSPMVYVEFGDNLIPIIIKDNNYEFRKVINDKLTNITLNAEYGIRKNSQYR